MNGAHDMGGMHGFGPVVREQNEPLFHAEWERTVFGMSRAMRARGIINIDESRHGIERMPPAEYLAASYYERWLSSLERVLVEKGIVTSDELESRIEQLREQPETPTPSRDDPDLYRLLTQQTSQQELYQREGPAPRFGVGDPVRTTNTHPTGHTRLPRYARGKWGTILLVHGPQALPDRHAHGQGECPEVVYNVRFDGREIWGASAEMGTAISIDLWESYLEPAPA